MFITCRHSGMEPRQHRMCNELRGLIFGYFLKERYLMGLVSEEALLHNTLEEKAVPRRKSVRKVYFLPLQSHQLRKGYNKDQVLFVLC